MAYATGLSLSNVLCLCGGSDMGRGWRRYKFSDFTRRDDGGYGIGTSIMKMKDAEMIIENVERIIDSNQCQKWP